MATQYILSSNEIPYECAWCSARSYCELVHRVQEVWGFDFNPIFKYRLTYTYPTRWSEYEIESGYELQIDTKHSNKKLNQESISSEKLNGPLERNFFSLINNDGKSYDESNDLEVNQQQQNGLRGQFYVIIDDDNDFQIWLHGSGSAASIGNNLPLHSHWTDTFHHVHYHTNEVEHPLTCKLLVFRKTFERDAPSIKLICSLNNAKEENYFYKYVDAECNNSSNNANKKIALRSSATVKTLETNSLNNIKEPYQLEECEESNSDHNTLRNYNHSFRSVKDSFLPLHSLLSPSLALRLNISVVLRHSNTSEVILLSSSRVMCNDSNAWGELVEKVSRAWGVHVPVFKYLDLHHGLTYINIVNILDYQLWFNNIATTNRRELFVYEQAPPLITDEVAKTCGMAAYNKLNCSDIIKHRQSHLPSINNPVTLEECVRKLNLLQKWENCANVKRQEYKHNELNKLLLQEDEENYYNENSECCSQSEKADVVNSERLQTIASNRINGEETVLHSNIHATGNDLEQIQEKTSHVNTELEFYNDDRIVQAHYKNLSKYFNCLKEKAFIRSICSAYS